MKSIRKIFISIIFIISIFCLNSCYIPSPLYGTWVDQENNKISFVNDGTFTARIQNSDKSYTNYDGNYVVIDNVLVFNITNEPVDSRITEWDIRGAILYIEWTVSSSSTKKLSLFHTGR